MGSFRWAKEVSLIQYNVSPPLAKRSRSAPWPGLITEAGDTFSDSPTSNRQVSVGACYNCGAFLASNSLQNAITREKEN